MQVILIIILLVWLLGPQLFTLVFGPTFHHTQQPFLLLLPGIFAMSVTVLMTAFFSGHGHVKLNVIGTGIGLLVVVVLDLFLVKTHGIKGAAVASSIGYGSFLLYALWHFKKLHAFTVKEMFSFSLNDWRWVKDVLLHKNSKA
jgi:O-antigen/teichoic acid export membrane protein